MLYSLTHATLHACAGATSTLWRLCALRLYGDDSIRNSLWSAFRASDPCSYEVSKAVAKKAQKKNSEAPTEFEAMTSAILVPCSTDWDMKPRNRWKQVKSWSLMYLITLMYLSSLLQTILCLNCLQIRVLLHPIWAANVGSRSVSNTTFAAFLGTTWPVLLVRLRWILVSVTLLT